MQKKSERLFRIFNRLKLKPQSIDQLHRWCLANDIPAEPRTLYRYLDELQATTIDSGFKVVTLGDGTRRRRWQVVSEKNPISTKLGDAITGFHLLSRLSGLHVQTIGMDYIATLSHEMLHALETEDRSSSVFNHLIVTGWGEVSYDEHDRSKLQTILKAIDEKIVVEVEAIHQLQAENATHVRRWLLHHLVSHRGSIFVAATNAKSDSVCFLDLESILHVKLQRQRFQLQLSRQRVEQALCGRFGITAPNGPSYTVKLGFLPSDENKRSGYLNPFLEKRNWHQDQRFYKDPSGLLVLEFKAPLSRELVGWIMMWLDHVTVLSPPQLIHLIDKKLDDMKRVVNGRRPFFSSPESF